jgi:hypothetical protein
VHFLKNLLEPFMAHQPFRHWFRVFPTLIEAYGRAGYRNAVTFFVLFIYGLPSRMSNLISYLVPSAKPIKQSAQPVPIFVGQAEGWEMRFESIDARNKRRAHLLLDARITFNDIPAHNYNMQKPERKDHFYVRPRGDHAANIRQVFGRKPLHEGRMHFLKFSIPPHRHFLSDGDFVSVRSQSAVVPWLGFWQSRGAWQ